MSETANPTRPLEEILQGWNPRIREYESVLGKVRRSRKKDALKQIGQLYDCTEAEALIVFEAMRAYEVGQPVQLVEIALSEVSSPCCRYNRSNPFDVSEQQYVGRRGQLIGPLVLDPKYGFRLNVGYVRPSEIDQVWKVVKLPIT
jgi:hypothetical protein